MRMPPENTATLGLALLSVVIVGCGPGGEREAAEGDAVASVTLSSTHAASAYSVPQTPAGELLDRALSHHDPDAQWLRRPIVLQWVSSQPGNEERVADLAIDNRRGAFALNMRHRGHDLDYHVEGEELFVQVDGSTEISPDVREAVSLHREDGLMWRNYFLFLVGLPMKLTDEGASMAPQTESTRFQGEAVQAIYVTYETEDGYPHWAFYFDPVSAALVGARFWRQAPDGDGEYIVMEGEIESGALRIPARRHWYMNADDAFLGTDEVRGLEVTQ